MRLGFAVVISLTVLGVGCRTSSPVLADRVMVPELPAEGRAGLFSAFQNDRQIEAYLAEAKRFREEVELERLEIRKAQLKIERELSAAEFRAVYGDVEEMIVTGSSEPMLLSPKGSEVAFDSASLESLGIAQFTPNLAVSALDGNSITNNQEFGVDEGDIVKRVGDYLIVLRRGRLYSVDVGRGPSDLMRVVDRQDVFPFSGRHQAWYDELLVSNGHLFVLGFSYETEAAELAVFELGSWGQIKHRESYAIRSNDYYSAENYGARLVNGRLVFYLPLDLEEAEGASGLSWPAYNTYDWRGDLGAWAPLVGSLEVLRPVQEGFPTLLHTMVECVFDTEGLDCVGIGIMGGWDAVHYVSPTATYLWVEGPRTGSTYAEFDADEGRDTRADSQREAERRLHVARAASRLTQEKEQGMLFRLPFDGSAIGAIELDGSPMSQFSFRETGEALDVFLRTEAEYEALRTSREWVRVDLSRFYDQDARAEGDEVESLPSASGDCGAHRFVGAYLLYASCEEGESSRSARGNGVYAVHLESRRLAEWLGTVAEVVRIERLGDDVLLVGENFQPRSDSSHLELTPVLLGEDPVLVDTLSLPGLMEAEGRSHAFNYTLFEDGALFGLPASRLEHPAKKKSSYDAWWNARQENEIAYFTMSLDGEIDELGSLFEGSGSSGDDECEVSCVDWYGSLRPIFMQERIFGLMGNSLVEGDIGRRGLKEIQRLNLLRD